MTWILKRTPSDRPMVAEYLCPVHGRFELTVERDANGDPPGEMPCPRLERAELGEWREPTSALGEILETPVPEATNSRHCFYNTCGLTSPFAISRNGFSKVRAVEAVRGGYEKPAHETYTNTEALGEGQSLEDWEDDRAKVWDRHREAEVYKMTKEL